MQYKYAYIKGDANTPFRFWTLIFITQKEYNKLSTFESEGFTLMNEFTTACFHKAKQIGII